MQEWWRRKWPWLTVLLLLSGLHLTTISREFGGSLGGDNIVYFLLSRALITGRGYVDLYLPGEPPHTKYPFLFPLLLAPFHLFFRNPLPAMHALVAILNALAAVVLGAWCGKNFGSRRMGLIFALAFGTMPRIYLQSLHLLTEPLYMLICFLALNQASLHKKEEISFSRFFLLVALCLAAFFTRTTGAVLAAAVVGALTMTKITLRIGERRLPAAFPLLTVFLIFAAAWIIRNRLVGGESTPYMAEFFAKDPYRRDLGEIGLSDLGERILRNLQYYLPMIGNYTYTPAWFFHLPKRAGEMAGYVLVLMIGGGVVREVREGRWLAPFFVLFSVSVVLVWPYWEDRFILPLHPLDFYFLVRALEWPTFRRGGASFRKILLTVIFLALFVTQTYSVTWLALNRFIDGRRPAYPVYVSYYGLWSDKVINWADYDVPLVNATPEDLAMLDAYEKYLIINRVAGKVVPPGTILMSRKPMITYVYSGRQSVPFLPDPRVDRQWEYIRKNRVEGVVLGLEQNVLQPLFQQYPHRFQEIAAIRNSEAVLLKVLPEKTPPTSPPK